MTKKSSGARKSLEVFFDRLWPICRSITGPGYRESLNILSEVMPMRRLRFPTGKKVLDWTVPREWVAHGAYFIDSRGKKHADFRENNLHLVNYSAPFRGTLDLSELKKHLYSLPEKPKAIPYVTSYYAERWGFCLSHEELRALPEGPCRIVIDTEFKKGRVEIGEAVLPGKSSDEILFSSYLCHPSMANNELSGPLVLAFLYRKIASLKSRRFTYRFSVMPETIGAICYLSVRGEALKKRLAAGYQITCVGDAGNFTYKKSRRGDTLADRAALAVLTGLGRPYKVEPFTPAMGSDERQYCSPGFDLPVGSLMRTMYAHYPEYHTSLDNKDFISFEALEDSIDAYFKIVQRLETGRIFKNTVSRGEPQLGRRGLYPTLGTQSERTGEVAAMMWLLNLADGSRDLSGIAEDSGQPLKTLTPLAEKLRTAGLLMETGASRRTGGR